MTTDGVWGVEVDAPALTLDGHYICLLPHADPDHALYLAGVIADALNGRKTPLVDDKR